MCWRCEVRLRNALHTLGELWPLLEQRLAPGSGPGKEPDAPRPPGPVAAPAPVNLEALSLPGEIARALRRHENEWRAPLGKFPGTLTGREGPMFAAAREFLLLNLTWACTGGHDHVDALDNDLRTLLRRTRSVTEGIRTAPRALAVPCPLPTSDGEGTRCGGELVYEPSESKIRCRACRKTVGYTHWAELAAKAGLIPTPLPKAA